jgi:hypothetical protein
MSSNYVSTLHALSGDVSGDAVVNDLDLYQVWQNLLRAPQDRDPAADIDRNGTVDQADVDSLLLLYQARLPAPGSPVPLVTGHRIGRGTAQRSRVGAVSIAFNAHVGGSLSADDLVVTHETSGTPLAPADMEVHFDPLGNLATWTFPGLSEGWLPEGRYTAVLPAGAVKDPVGRSVTTDSILTFHVLTGDVNGDAVTDDLDLYEVWSNLLRDPDDRDLNEDVTGNGQVDEGDVLVVMANYRRALPLGVSPAQAALPSATAEAGQKAAAQAVPDQEPQRTAGSEDSLPGYYATAAFYEPSSLWAFDTREDAGGLEPAWLPSPWAHHEGRHDTMAPPADQMSAFGDFEQTYP